MWDQTPGGAVPEFVLSDRCQKAREYAGLDQGELADRLGVARSTVARVEQGKTVRVKRPLLLAWALATGVNLQWLETGEVPSPDDDGGSECPRQESNLRPRD
ncbi:helix-turn-helix domain-containing protein [Prescottella equi]